MITPEEIDRLRGLCRDATGGPWRADTRQRGDAVVWGPGVDEFVSNIGAVMSRVPFDDEGIPETVAFDAEEANCRFIAAAREALPRLLDEVERMQKDRETLRTAMKRVHKDAATIEIEDIAHDALDATGDHSDGWGDCR